MTKEKLIVFHSAIAPYRIDLFNDLNNSFDADFYFFRKNLLSQKFETNKLEYLLNFKPKFLTLGFELLHKGRMIRFGYLSKILKKKPSRIICLEYNPITISVILFTKLFFPKTKVYTICDDSIDVAQKCSLLRKIARALCIVFLDGIILGNDSVEKWYNINYPKVQTIMFPIIQKEERIIDIIKEGETISKTYLNKFDLEDKIILLFVGRLVEVKNLYLLIEVFSQYVSKNKKVVLILVGDGDKKLGLIELVKQLNIQNNVIFAGRFENEALYAWYQIADHFILPSTSETFGAVVNESLIAGVPVMCSSLAGASCLINEKNGIIFNPYNKEKLLSVFNLVLCNNRQTKRKISLKSSLMPYTYNERIIRLISFLKKP